jgi:hypothetical protein
MPPVWVFFGVIWLFGFYQPGRSIIMPVWKRDPVACRDLSDLELKEKGYVPEGKAAPYAVASESICEKNIFRFGERWSYAEFVVGHAQPTSRVVAHNLIEIYSREKSLDRDHVPLPIFVDVESVEDPSIRQYLRTLYHEAVTLNLGSRSAIRTIDPGASYRILRIGLRKVIDPETLFVIELSNPIQPGSEKRTWVTL